MQEEEFDRLVGLIYESALDPELWPVVLNELTCLVGADTFHLLGWDSGEQAGAPEDSVHDSASNALAIHNSYCIVNPGSEHVLKANAGVVIGHLAYHEYANVGLALLRDAQEGSFAPEHEAMLARLLPHLHRSLRLMEHTRTATRSGELACAGQDAASLGVIALDKNGRFLHCNRNGEALLKAAEVLCLCDGVLACTDQNQKKRLAEAMNIIVQTGKSANLLLNNRVRPDERYSITLTPLPKQGITLAGEAEGVLCLAFPLDHRRIATARQLMQLFGLSAAEARLVRALASGDTLESYARENGLKMPTVKSQLRSAFEKTDTGRQSALVRLIVGIPAVREPG
jgi:DNA-binding CsgD family transcriptional regulator